MPNRILSLFRNLFRKRAVEQELDDELRSSVEALTQEKMKQGLSQHEARREALIEFGGVEQVKEEVRDVLAGRILEDFARDIRYAFRTLAKSPGFTTIAVLTLALGIGANTAIFSVVYGVLLRPLPYPHPERIITISRTYQGELDYSNFTAAGFDFWKEHNDPFQYVAASTDTGFNLGGAGRAVRVRAGRVSVDYFRLLGVGPVLGRAFLPEEDEPGGANVAILSYSLWKRQFGGDPKVIARTILLDGAPFTVVGVMPAGFQTIPPKDLWTTIAQVNSTVGGGWNYDVIARLKPAVTRLQADGYLAGLTQPFLKRFFPKMKEQDRKAVRFAAFPYRYTISSDYHTPLFVLFGAIGFVLLIACANVANLLLARAAAREKEIAVRAALGAGRARIIRQLLTESVLMSVLGGALGIALAYGGVHALVALAPPDLPRARTIALDGWAFGFTALVAVATGVFFGLAPAFRTARVRLNESLKEGTTRASVGTAHHRLGAALVVGEVALSLVLLAGAGLLIRTFANLLRTDPGFDPNHVLSIPIWTAGSHFKAMPALANFYSALLRKIDSLPGVQSGAVVGGGLPLERGVNLNPGVRVAGRVINPSVDFREIAPKYFNALGVAVLAGRTFTAADNADAAKVAVINRAFADRFYHNQNPVGHHLILGKNTAEVVGVVGDVRSELNEQAPPTYLVPIAQASYATDELIQGWFPITILVRTAVRPLSLGHAITSAVEDAAPDVPVGELRSMDQVLATSLAFQRLLMTLLSVFASIAVVLAAVGIYGVISYRVAQRRHEIGIRMALGAERTGVLKLVVGQAFKLTLVGVAIGVIGALALTRLLTTLLFGVKPDDPATFVVISMILPIVALGASYLPARRAMKVDPIIALRYE